MQIAMVCYEMIGRRNANIRHLDRFLKAKDDVGHWASDLKVDIDVVDSTQCVSGPHEPLRMPMLRLRHMLVDSDAVITFERQPYPKPENYERVRGELKAFINEINLPRITFKKSAIPSAWRALRVRTATSNAIEIISSHSDRIRLALHNPDCGDWLLQSGRMHADLMNPIRNLYHSAELPCALFLHRCLKRHTSIESVARQLGRRSTIYLLAAERLPLAGLSFSGVALEKILMAYDCPHPARLAVLREMYDDRNNAEYWGLSSSIPPNVISECILFHKALSEKYENGRCKHPFLDGEQMHKVIDLIETGSSFSMALEQAEDLDTAIQIFLGEPAKWQIPRSIAV